MCVWLYVCLNYPEALQRCCLLSVYGCKKSMMASLIRLAFGWKAINKTLGSAPKVSTNPPSHFTADGLEGAVEASGSADGAGGMFRCAAPLMSKICQSSVMPFNKFLNICWENMGKHQNLMVSHHVPIFFHSKL